MVGFFLILKIFIKQCLQAPIGVFFPWEYLSFTYILNFFVSEFYPYHLIETLVI